MIARTPRVLIYLGNEFKFAFESWLPEGYLAPTGYQFTKMLATLDPSIIFNYDILVIEQVTTNILFSKNQIDAIREFVLSGGGLFLIGKGWQWQNIYRDCTIDSYPLNILANEFEFNFSTKKAEEPFTINEHELTKNVNEFVTWERTAGTLTSIGGIIPLILDSDKQIVVAARNLGKGRVVVSAEDVFISSHHTGDPLMNYIFITNIFQWLSFGMIAKNREKKIPPRIVPENVIQIGTTKLYYSSALEERTKFLQDIFQYIFTELRTMHDVDIVFDLIFIALSTSGGGYSGGSEIGIGVLGSRSNIIKIMAHEMTHSWVLPGPLPGALNEGWAILAAIRVAQKLNYGEQANKQRARLEQIFRQSDPDGKLIDISHMPPAPPENQPYIGKAMWVIETIEKKYGADFMSRLMRIKRESKKAQINMNDMITYINLAANDDLHSFFKEINTTLK